MKIDFHIHSKYSPDSLMKPSKIIAIAKKRGLNGVAVTDHDSLKGGLAIQEINTDKNFLVVVGMEIRTEIGDMIGLFLKKEIKSRNSLEVIEEIHAQGGLAVLPHPFRGHKLNQKVISQVDLIEVYNARDKQTDTQKALALAKRHKKPIIAGSDAHSYSEIGRTYLILNDRNIKQALLKGKPGFYLDYTSQSKKEISQIIKTISRRKFHRLLVQIPAYFWYLIQGK